MLFIISFKLWSRKVVWNNILVHYLVCSNCWKRYSFTSIMQWLTIVQGFLHTVVQTRKVETCTRNATARNYTYRGVEPTGHCTSRNFSAMRRVGTLVNYLLPGLQAVEKYHQNTSVKRGVLNIFKGKASKYPLE